MGKEIRHHISKRIREFRNLRGLTQAELSEMSKVAYKYIQQIEGKNPPNIRVDTLARISKTLRVKCSDLINF